MALERGGNKLTKTLNKETNHILIALPAKIKNPIDSNLIFLSKKVILCFPLQILKYTAVTMK